MFFTTDTKSRVSRQGLFPRRLFVEATTLTTSVFGVSVLANCKFICTRHDTITVITTKEASGDWKATAVRSSNDTREALLSSDACSSLQKAMESLHLKSAEATSIHIKTSGYTHPPDIKQVSDSDDDGDDAASIVSESSSGSSVDSVFSDEEEARTPASSSGPRVVQVGAKRSRKSGRRSKARQQRRSRGEESDDERVPAFVSTARPPVVPAAIPRQPQPQHGPPSWAIGCPPPPPPPPHPISHRNSIPVLPLHHAPPAYTHRPPGGPAPLAPASHLPLPPPPLELRPAGPAGPGAGVRPVPALAPVSGRPFNVRIAVRWLHHGEVRFLECCQPSIRALQDMTVGYVRRHMNAFENVTPLDYATTRTLIAHVKQAFFGSEAYDMSGYRGDDLSKLLNVLSQDDVPLFEVEVETVRTVPPPPPPINPVPPIVTL